MIAIEKNDTGADSPWAQQTNQGYLSEGKIPTSLHMVLFVSITLLVGGVLGDGPPIQRFSFHYGFYLEGPWAFGSL